MKLKEIREQVMSGAVGTNVLHHGNLLPLVRRPLLGFGMIPFEQRVKKKKKKKKKINEVTLVSLGDKTKMIHGVSPHRRNPGSSLKYTSYGSPEPYEKRIRMTSREFNKESFTKYISTIPLAREPSVFAKKIALTKKWKGFDLKKALKWAKETAGKPSTYLLMRKALVGEDK
jgi:hypothetical protein